MNVLVEDIQTVLDLAFQIGVLDQDENEIISEMDQRTRELWSVNRPILLCAFYSLFL